MRNVLNLTLGLVLILVSAGIYGSLRPPEVDIPGVPESTGRVENTAPPDRSKMPASRYWSLAGKNLFHPDRVGPDEEPVDETSGEDLSSIDPPRVTLYGTLIAGAYKVAFLRDGKDRRSGVQRYEIGSTIQEFDILDILPDRVVFQKGGGIAEVELDIPQTRPTNRGAQGRSGRTRSTSQTTGRDEPSRTAREAAQRQRSEEEKEEEEKAEMEAQRQRRQPQDRQPPRGRSPSSWSASGRRQSTQKDELPPPFQAIFGRDGSSSSRSGRR